MTPDSDYTDRAAAYWKRNIRILIGLLSIWFTVSLGFGVLLVDVLDQFQIGGFRLGFWFSQQGSIYVFVVLIFVYVRMMNKLDHEFDFADDDEFQEPHA